MFSPRFAPPGSVIQTRHSPCGASSTQWDEHHYLPDNFGFRDESLNFAPRNPGLPVSRTLIKRPVLSGWVNREHGVALQFSPVSPHNPVRKTWQAEDSRVYWLPDMKRYGIPA